MLLALVLPPVSAVAVEQVPGVIHIDALGVDAGGPTVAQAVGMVERAGLGVAIITPHDQSVVEYGLPPFRRLLKFGETRPSIRSYGAPRYVDEVAAADAQTPGVVTIHGAEAVPAYYWAGSLWGGPLTVKNIHKHLLVIGLPGPEDYERLPSVAAGFPVRFTIRCLPGLWPALLTLLGAFMIILARMRSAKGMPQTMTPGLLIAGLGVVFIIDRYPFCPLYDPYHGDPGEGPYQAVIDYANARDALTFWAHPEVWQRTVRPAPWPASMLVDSVAFETRPYASSLLQTTGYTGFAVFEEGMLAVGRPGGIWDQTLIEYCAGVRSKPVWAIGEVDFESPDPDDDITTCQTVFLVEDRTRNGVLQALREGRMYARRAPGLGLSIRDFTVSDTAGQRYAAMGERLTLNGSPHIRIAMDFKTAPSRPVELVLIRGGTPIRTFYVTDTTPVTFEDPVLGGSGTTFYRFIAQMDGWPVLASNPVFVTINTP